MREEPCAPRRRPGEGNHSPSRHSGVMCASFAISQHFWTGVKLLTKWYPHDCERTYLYLPFPTRLSRTEGRRIWAQGARAGDPLFLSVEQNNKVASVSQSVICDGPAPRSPLYRLAVRLRHSPLPV